MVNVWLHQIWIFIEFQKNHRIHTKNYAVNWILKCDAMRSDYVRWSNHNNR